MISEGEKGYLAGILDGEGYLSVRLRNKKWLAPIVRVDNTSFVMIKWLHDRYGGCLSFRKENRKNKRDIWIWSCSYSTARRVLQDALPYLVHKIVHAQTILSIPTFSKIRIKNNSRFGRGMTSLDDLLVSKVLNRMKQLNKRGRDNNELRIESTQEIEAEEE